MPFSIIGEQPTTMSFTIGQQRALALVPKVTGGLSVLSSITIGIVILRDRTKRSKVYHRLILGMCIVDISSSIWLSLSTWPIPTESGILYAIGTNQTCTIQGFFTQFGISSPLYNVSLSCYFLLVVKYSWKEQQLRRSTTKEILYFHLGPWIWAFSTAIAGLILNIFHSANLWCWIANATSSQQQPQQHDADRYRWLFFYGPLWLTLLIVTLLLFLVFQHVRNVTLRTEQYTNPIQQFQQQQQGSSRVFGSSSSRRLLMEGGGGNRNEGRGGGGGGGGGGGEVVIEETLKEQDDEDDEDLMNAETYYDQGFEPPSKLSSSQRLDPATTTKTTTSTTTANLPTASTSSKAQTTSNRKKLEGDEVEVEEEPSLTTLSIPQSPTQKQQQRRGVSFRTQVSLNRSSQFLGLSMTSFRLLDREQQRQQQQRQRTESAKRRREVAYQCLRYSLAFYWTWVPISLVRIYQSIDKPVPYSLLLLAACNTPMQGLPNFLIYLYPLLVHARKQHPTKTIRNWIRISLTPASQNHTQNHTQNHQNNQSTLPTPLTPQPLSSPSPSPVQHSNDDLLPV